MTKVFFSVIFGKKVVLGHVIHSDRDRMVNYATQED